MSTPISRIRRAHGVRAHLYYQKHVANIETMSEASERSKAYSCSLCSEGWRYAISMRALTRTTMQRCAASAARSGVTPLILRASNTTNRFSSRSSNFIPKIHQKRSQEVRNPKSSWRACPQTPLAGALHAL